MINLLFISVLISMKKCLLLCMLVLLVESVYAQEATYKSNYYKFGKKSVTNISEVRDDWHFSMVNLSSPRITNNIYKHYLWSVKEEVEKLYPRRNINGVQRKTTDEPVPGPVILRSFQGNIYDFNGVPNDNTLAVSVGGDKISAVNTNIYHFNADDSLIRVVSLGAFADTLPVNSHLYDPKTLYDPLEDRFVIVFLAGNVDNESNIVVAFSETNDPSGDWNLYVLPGNPLNDTSWTDYPAIALTQGELFLTCNLLRNGGSWQTSFKQSVVWQINKFDGYAGDSLDVRLWHDITFNGGPLRNTNPVQGGDSLRGPDIYLLSNRNFAIQCDTVFLIHISGKLDSAGTGMTIRELKADKSYGMPPDARETAGQQLATNDARVLGAFLQNGKIQFVGNTIDTTTGTSAVYHGVIINPGSDHPLVKGNIISDTIDYGYPNLSYSGTKSYDDQALITFNFSAISVFAGFGGVYADEPGKYSPLTVIKPGEVYINQLQGSYERWGDYTGTQRNYAEAGKVWASGSFGIPIQRGYITYRTSNTWIAELETPNPDKPPPFVIDRFIGNVFPNPFMDDQITIEFDLPENDYIEISVFDMQGKLVKTLYKSITPKGVNRAAFSVLPLRAGVYFVYIKNKSKILYTKKIIKG